MSEAQPEPQPGNEKRELRGIDRSNDYRLICPGCKRDFGGTVAPLPGYEIREILCASCEFGTIENWLIQKGYAIKPVIVPTPEPPPPVVVEQAKEQERFAVCDVYANGCGKGFMTTEHSSAAPAVCGSCKYKHMMLQTLYGEYKALAGFGHTHEPDADCELCAIQNQIDSLAGYDWREESDKLRGLI